MLLKLKNWKKDWKWLIPGGLQIVICNLAPVGSLQLTNSGFSSNIGARILILIGSALVCTLFCKTVANIMFRDPNITSSILLPLITMMKRISYILLLFLSSTCAAQEFITIRGKVTGSQNNNPLPYSTVKLKNHPVGVITNEEGMFELYIEKSHLHDTLYISTIGYAIYQQALKNIVWEKPLQITLIEKPYELNEVVVGIQYNPKEVIKNVTNNLANNYSLTPFILDGFLRMYTKDHEKYNELIEADISLYTKGYISKKRSWEYHSIFLNEVKSSLSSGTVKDMFIHPNVLNKIIEFHETLIKDIETPKQEYECSIDRTEYMGDVPIVYLKMYKKSLERSDEFTALIKINTGNWAIEEIEYDRHITRYTDAQIYNISSADSLKSRGISDKLLIKYKNYKGKYYLNYFNWKVKRNIITPTSNYDYYMTFEYATNNIIYGATKKINSLLINRKDNLYKQFNRKPYHPEFWKNYNLLLDNPEMVKVHSDIREK